MSTGFIRDVPNGCVLNVRVHPGARTNAVTGAHADAVKISLTTPPVDGRANEALLTFVAEALRLPKARVVLLIGISSRNKTLEITGKSAAEVQAALSPIVSC